MNASAVKTRAVDFNTLLKVANLVVTGLVLFGYGEAKNNDYLDQQTIVLAALLGAQTHLALMIERRRRDPFVILLAFEMIFYYSLRIFTLTMYPFSSVFERYSYAVSDTNYALTFILIANLFLYAGFFLGHARGNAQRIDSHGWRATSPALAVALLIAAILFGYLTGRYWTEDNVPRAFHFLILILAPNIVVLMALSYYFLYRRSLGKKFALAIAILILLEMIVHTLIGSRSAIVGFILNWMMVTLAIAGCIQFSRKFVALGVILFPVLVLLLVASFAISTYNRAARELGSTMDIRRAIELVQESGSLLSADMSLDVLVPPIAARAGFFDFAAEIIAHRDQYRELLSLSTYGKSIIDNVLTPGFDVFDQPKTSNALQFAYRGWGAPSKQQVPDSYQSDQLGIYGEFYALFGYLSLPMLFVFAYVLKRLYVGLRSSNPFIHTLKRLVVLFVFIRTLDSFGFDWTVSETLPLVAAMVMYIVFFSSRRVRQEEQNPPAATVPPPLAVP